MDTLNQTISPEIPTGLYMRNWQHAGLRMLRAQERVLQGFAQAAKLEIKYGQDLAGSRLALLDWTATDQDARANHAAREVESLMTMMRDVTEELHHSFSDAAKLLTENAESEAKETMRETQAAMDKSLRTAADAGTKLAREAVSKVRDAMPEEDREV